MDDYNETDIPPGPPPTPADLALAHFDVPRDLGTLPFGPDDKITRSLWVVYVGEWRIWTHAILPLDNRLDMGDPANIEGTCDLVAHLMSPRVSYEEVLVILRRPASPHPSEADWRICRLIRKAAATRETAPWSFFITGPDGARELYATDPNTADLTSVDDSY
jgi:hypothetical protein